MELLETEFNTLKPSFKGHGLHLIEEAMEQLKGLMAVAEVAVTEEEYKKKYVDYDEDSEEFSYMQLDVLENYLQLPQLNELALFAEHSGARYANINRRVRSFVSWQSSLQELLDNLVEMYIPLTDSDIEKVASFTKTCLNNLTSFIFFFYDIGYVKQQYDDNEEDIKISIDLYSYADIHDLDLKGLVTMLYNVRFMYKADVKLLDQFPEFASKFYDIVGASAEDFEALEDNLTKKDFLALVNEDYKGTLDEFIASIEARSYDE